MTKTLPICVRIPSTMHLAMQQLVRDRKYKSISHIVGTALRTELLARKLKRAVMRQINTEQPTQRVHR